MTDNTEYQEQDGISTRPDFMSRVLRTAASCIDYSLLLTSADKKSAEKLVEALNGYANSLPVANFLVLSTIRDNIITPVIGDQVMYLFFSNYDRILLQHLQSELGMDYSSILDTLLKYSSTGVATVRENSVLTDRQYIEGYTDIKTINELLINNSILFSVYLFRLSLPFSECYRLAE